MPELRGLENVLRVLNTTQDRTAKKMAKAGVNAGLGPLVKAVRAAINAAPVSAEMKKAARKTVNKRLLRKEGQPYVGKAGFGVGKATKRRKESAHERFVRGQGGRGEVRGVGISQSNIHWPVLGTQQRRTAKGHSTGKMDSLLAGLVQQAASGSRDAMLAAARDKITKVLQAETAAARK